MTNKEHIQTDLVIAFDFIEQIIGNPDVIDKIPEGSAITFVNEENAKIEKKKANIPIKKYVKVKRHFEVL